MKEKLALSVLALNHSGVLPRMTGLFSRRGFNIQSLTASETEDPEVSRITIVALCDPATFRQVEKQVWKLEDVKKVVRLDLEQSSVSELALVKVAALNKDRGTVLRTVTKYGARIKDIGHTSMTVELTGQSETLDAFIQEIKEFGIIEMARTGITALAYGDKGISDDDYAW